MAFAGLAVFAVVLVLVLRKALPDWPLRACERLHAGSVPVMDGELMEIVGTIIVLALIAFYAWGKYLQERDARTISEPEFQRDRLRIGQLVLRSELTTQESREWARLARTYRLGPHPTQKG